MIELKPEDTRVRVNAVTRTINTDTGAFVDVPRTGLTNGVISVVRTKAGVALVSEDLVEVGSVLGIYSAILSGAEMAAAMSDLPDGALLFRKTQFGTETPWFEAIIWRTIVYV